VVILHAVDRTAHVYDAMELQSKADKSLPISEAECEIPSLCKVDTKPRIRKSDAIKLQANPAYRVAKYNKP